MQRRRKKETLEWKMRSSMKEVKIVLIVSVFVLLLAGCTSQTPSSGLTVFKSANCGCCGIWSQYMEKEGFDVDVQVVSNLDAVKSEYEVPKSMESCHTAIIDGYVVEGHIPVEAIHKLLEERPDIKGIALPNMPLGSPGMPGIKKGPFVVYAIHHDGSTSEFMRI
jgi:hypothetical protein